MLSTHTHTTDCPAAPPLSRVGPCCEVSSELVQAQLGDPLRRSKLLRTALRVRVITANVQHSCPAWWFKSTCGAWPRACEDETGYEPNILTPVSLQRSKQSGSVGGCFCTTPFRGWGILRLLGGGGGVLMKSGSDSSVPQAVEGFSTCCLPAQERHDRGSWHDPGKKRGGRRTQGCLTVLLHLL